MKKISILGSTGSIGTQTLEVVRSNGDIQVTASLYCLWTWAAVMVPGFIRDRLLSDGWRKPVSTGPAAESHYKRKWAPGQEVQGPPSAKVDIILLKICYFPFSR